MRAGTGFHCQYALGFDQATSTHSIGIFLGGQIIRDHRQISTACAEARDQLLE
jgi:ABC-type tungstate transport system substrate-binding protein